MNAARSARWPPTSREGRRGYGVAELSEEMRKIERIVLAVS